MTRSCLLLFGRLRELRASEDHGDRQLNEGEADHVAELSLTDTKRLLLDRCEHELKPSM